MLMYAYMYIYIYKQIGLDSIIQVDSLDSTRYYTHKQYLYSTVKSPSAFGLVGLLDIVKRIPNKIYLMQSNDCTRQILSIIKKMPNSVKPKWSSQIMLDYLFHAKKTHAQLVCIFLGLLQNAMDLYPVPQKKTHMFLAVSFYTFSTASQKLVCSVPSVVSMLGSHEGPSSSMMFSPSLAPKCPTFLYVFGGSYS